MPSVASTCVLSAGWPPVRRYTLLKSPSVQMRLSSVEVRYSVRMEGQVTNLNFCHAVAPSTLAASYCSFGIARRPATRISVQKGSAFQMCTTIAMIIASGGVGGQVRPSLWDQREKREFTTPPFRRG